MTCNVCGLNHGEKSGGFVSQTCLDVALAEVNHLQDVVRKAISWAEFTDDQMDELCDDAGIQLTTVENCSQKPCLKCPHFQYDCDGDVATQEG